jgi:hypothetical protein
MVLINGAQIVTNDSSQIVTKIISGRQLKNNHFSCNQNKLIIFVNAVNNISQITNFDLLICGIKYLRQMLRSHGANHLYRIL